MKPQIDNDIIHTSLKIFNTHQTTGKCWMRFQHSSHQTLSEQALILNAIRPCMEKLATTD